MKNRNYFVLENSQYIKFKYINKLLMFEYNQFTFKHSDLGIARSQQPWLG